MDPAAYRDRYPKQLSGGQRQRIGVARAMSADPDVMLMDEPFGAIDPITRDRLQNEFLRLQAEIKKTIVFVTHDIDEAIKMGDRIAILRERSHIAQFDTPERILVEPGRRVRRGLHRPRRVAQAAEPEPGARHRAARLADRLRRHRPGRGPPDPAGQRPGLPAGARRRGAARGAGSTPTTCSAPRPGRCPSIGLPLATVRAEGHPQRHAQRDDHRPLQHRGRGRRVRRVLRAWSTSTRSTRPSAGCGPPNGLACAGARRRPRRRDRRRGGGDLDPMTVAVPVQLDHPRTWPEPRRLPGDAGAAGRRAAGPLRSTSAARPWTASRSAGST